MSNKSQRHKIASDCWNQAQKFLVDGRVGPACAHILIALKFEPSWKNRLKVLFSDALRKWGKELERQNDYVSLINGYEQALEVCPENEFIINDLGAFLYRLGHLKKALEHFKQATLIRPGFVEGHRNLRTCLSAMVDRWHFRMLNDNDRNEAYREAILKKVKQGFNRVLDIGTGTGLLSIFAVDGSAQFATDATNEFVFACEHCEIMYDIADAVLEHNAMELYVQLINKNSSELTLDDLSEKRVSLVVTETVDAGLFGEDILRTLIHAWENLLLPPLPLHSLLPPSPCMICNDKELEPHQREAPRVNGIVIPFGATVWLAAVECSHIARKYRSLHKSHHQLNTPFIFKFISDDPYDTENLQSFPDGYKLLCDPVKCFYVNFNNPQNLMDFENGKFDDDCHKLEFRTEGTLDAFVVWFDLHVDEDLKITTSPFDENASTCCWDQAIFPFQSELQVSTGSYALLKVKTKDSQLLVELSDVQIMKNTKYEEVPVSQEFVRFFNNSDFINKLYIYSQDLSDMNSILDFSPFPFLGMMLASVRNCNLCFVAKCEFDILAVRKIAEQNQIPSERIMYILESDVDGSKLITKSPFDLIISNLVDSVGEISDMSISQLSLSRNFLKDGGLIFPKNIGLWGQLISSDWVTRSSEVLRNGIVEEYNIPEFMNEYKVAHQLDLHPTTLRHNPLSEPCQLGVFSILDIISDESKRFKEKIEVKTAGKVSALLYWFQYETIRPQNNDIIQFSTRSIESHVNQVGVLMENKHLKQKQLVSVLCDYQNSGFLFKFKIH